MKEMSDSRPLVSVIMPTYNQGELIGQAIESVLDQTYKNLELIIIDNYSDDVTEKIITRFKDKRIKYFKFRNNGIIAASRNYGIGKARGEYIAFLDSDDLWLEGKIEMQVNQFESDRKIRLSYVLYYALFEDGSTSGPFPKARNRFRGKIFDSLYLKAVIANSGVMVPSYIFEELGLLSEDRQLVAAEDYDMWLRIVKTGMADYIKEKPLLLYRVWEKANSGGSFKKWWRMILVARRHCSYAGKLLYFRAVMTFSFGLLKSLIFKN